ncbi:MAG: MFS transporter [Actinomycetota bacterium]
MRAIDPPVSAGARKRWWTDERLLVICGSTSLVMAGQGVVSPVLPFYARDFGVSTAVVGLTFTAFGLARLVLNVPAGLWADRAGRRVLLVGGPILTAIGMIGSGLAPSIWALLAWRLVAGAGSALYMTGAQIYLIDIAAEELRARYVATNQGALLLGVSIGPAIGGLLAEAYSLRTPFLVVGVGAAFTALYGFLRLPETRGSAAISPTDATADNPTADDASGTPTERRRAQLAFLTSSQFVAIGLVSMAMFAIRAGFRQTLVPLHAADAFGFSTGDLGIVFTALGVLALVLIGPAGWAADRFGRKAVIIPTGVISAVGVLVTAGAPVLELFLIGIVITAIGTGVTGPAPAAFVADIAPADQRGAAMGLYRTWGDLGIVLAPVLAGALADVTSIPVAMAAISAVAFAGVGWFQLVGREPERAVSPS